MPGTFACDAHGLEETVREWVLGGEGSGPSIVLHSVAVNGTRGHDMYMYYATKYLARYMYM